jgi:hypothetical protein
MRQPSGRQDREDLRDAGRLAIEVAFRVGGLQDQEALRPRPGDAAGEERERTDRRRRHGQRDETARRPAEQERHEERRELGLDAGRRLEDEDRKEEQQEAAAREEAGEGNPPRRRSLERMQERGDGRGGPRLRG